jgi:aquaglyceroporin related protein
MAEKKIAILSPPSPGSPTVSHDEDIHAKRASSSGSDPEAAAYAEHGPGIDHQITQENVVESEPELLWSRIRHYMRDPFSEFLGVFILILFGDGVVAQVVLSDGVKGAYQSIVSTCQVLDFLL